MLGADPGLIPGSDDSLPPPAVGWCSLEVFPLGSLAFRAQGGAVPAGPVTEELKGCPALPCRGLWDPTLSPAKPREEQRVHESGHQPDTMLCAS